jgi:hypothetical protein
MNLKFYCADRKLILSTKKPEAKTSGSLLKTVNVYQDWTAL